jgi:D-3-phosphoglycerate dehydrogenase
MKVLVADKFEPVGVAGLRDLGCVVALRPDVKAEDLPAAVAEVHPQVLIVRGKRVSEAALAAGPELLLVIRAGAGVDTIDVAAASRLGVAVANCPGKNSIAVAELVIGLLISLDRRIPDQVADLRRGEWLKSEYSKARGLYGRTLGIVGFGQIGREIATRARAFGMKVVACSLDLTQEEADRLGIGYCQTPLEVAGQSDAVSINVAGGADTRHLVNAEFLAAMKPGAYLINASRGSVVDEAALERAVRERGIRAGLDVYQSEPSAGKAPFAPAVVAAPGVYGTHHVGASTDQAQVAIAIEAVRIVAEFVKTGIAPHCVNTRDRVR